MTEEIEAAALVELVKAINPNATLAKLRRWHRKGLLCRPRQVGRGKGAGSISKYPLEAIEPAKTIAALLKERRDFDWVGWKLWLMDYPVDDRYWRPRLTAAAELWDKTIPIIRNYIDADDDRFSELISDLFHGRSDQPMFAAIRKALGANRFEEIMGTLFDMSVGYDVGPGHDPESDDYRKAVDVMDLALGLRNTRTDHFPGGPTLLRNEPNSPVGDYLPLLKTLGETFNSVSWSKFLNDLTPTALNEAKRELVNALGYFAVMDSVFSAILGPDSFGLRRAASLRPMLSNGDLTLAIIGWAIWRQTPGPAEMVDQIRLALEANGLPHVSNMERFNIAPPNLQIPPKKLRRTRRVYPHQEWVNSKNNS